MTSKSARRGKSFEYEVRDLLREATGNPHFERTPHSGAWTGGLNSKRIGTSRDSVVEVMTGDLICPENWRWVVEAKNEEDVPVHQLFMGVESKRIDGFLNQVNDSALAINKEPLIFMKWRKKSWKLPKKIIDILNKNDIYIPNSNSSTIGIIVGERKDFCNDIPNINFIEYNLISNTGTVAWRFFDFENWKNYLKCRSTTT